MADFNGKNVVILGFGTEGASVAKFLSSRGTNISVFDIRSREKFDEKKLEKLEEEGVKFTFDAYPKSFQGVDFVVRSPGIRLSSAIISKAKKEKVEITSATKIFFDFCPAKIIGVTGTKGKGTTSSLIYQMLQKQGYKAFLGGNIGNSPLDFLEELDSESWVVLELSSFQLQDLEKSPHIAVMLMITSEHLDYHHDITEYIEAKRNIIRHQNLSDFAVINRDYPAALESDIHANGQIYYVSSVLGVERGVYFSLGALWLRDKSEDTKIIDVNEILIPGKHNYENASAAACAAYLAGVSLVNIKTVLKEFKGLEHRLELVATVRGVKYYDDSFSTTPETAIAAIEAFSEPEILLLGGSSKKSDFAELGKTIREAKNIKAIVSLGDEWTHIKAEIGNLPNVIFAEDSNNLHEAVTKAAELAEVGDVVLLTPACASFNWFSGYKERGEQFKEEVNSLA